jgi:hypothetical protein
MCPPAASSVSLRELGPIVPTGVWWVVGAGGLPGTAIGRPGLVVVNSTTCLNGGCGVVSWEGAQHRWRGQWLGGEGAFCCFGGLAGEGALAAAMVMIAVGHIGVIDRAVVPKVGVPLWEDAVSVVAVDMQSQTPATPMPHS